MMEIQEVIKKVDSLCENAEELGNAEYIELFEAVMKYLCEYDRNYTLLKVFDKMVREEIGPEKHSKISAKAAEAAFWIDINKSEDSDFKKFVLDNFDEIVDKVCP